MSGIYQIRNIVNNKIYIGSSRRLNKRKIAHFSKLRTNKHHSPALQKAFIKYGEDKFIFELIILCDETLLLKLENMFIRDLDPEYNCSKNTFAPMTGRKHSEETLNKMRTAIRPRGDQCYNYGKKTPEHIKEKQRLKKIGSKRPEKTKLKMRETALRIKAWERMKQHIENNKRPVISSEGITFASTTDAAKYYGITVQTMGDILHGRHFRTRKKISFKYVDKSSNME